MPKTQYNITAIPAFTDNYIWCIHNQTHAAVVDPGDALPVMEFLNNNKLILTDILITHHHHDHTGGISTLLDNNAELTVFGPQNERIKGITQRVAENDVVTIDSLGIAYSVLSVPGHTLDHIAFSNDTEVFCGDTLFSAGCGRMFEGTPEMFVHSLDKLANLPEETKVFCTHEYTLANLAFAKHVDASNNDLHEYANWAERQREEGLITLPSDIKTQKLINPFLRANDPKIQSFLQASGNLSIQDSVSCFASLRALKDNF
ncbi:hydroxyacylglutathione hydrolase [Glaciecola sp. KUL10]|uniref:hydroxyacylglutathione hydrolase n=1 Tax=Glaciecola sp. (strain KUL10) TaxID=2161813 RepID=UPI000D78A584|nr:hydroxyacylglutathione hydrolase [Glaciecola sp. KUL10]GBL05442.1 hydroxyacylglutathione hydrolase [Glaciecola sp. KUL10]